MANWGQFGSFGASSASWSGGATAAQMETELQFLSGASSSGRVVAQSFWTWNGDSPATYAGVSSGHKWGSTTIGAAGGTVYYYFDPAANWTRVEENAFKATLTLWSDVANVKFAQTTIPGNANAIFYRGNDGSAYESDTTLNSAIGGATLNIPSSAMISIDTNAQGFGPIGGSFDKYGGYPWQTLIHEEGHLIGLGHAGPYNGNVDSSTQQLGPYDTRQWSLMSYIDPWDTGAKFYSSYTYKNTNWGTSSDGYSREPTTWMPLDIVAAERLYGLPTSTPLSGGQTFGFHCNVAGLSAKFFNFTINKSPVITLWDKGAHNKLDLSGFTTGSIVFLSAGRFSSCDGMKNNIGIAFGVKIDTAIGGAGRDRLYANQDGDVLQGGAGVDKLVGSSGADRLTGGLGADTLTGGGGADQFNYNAKAEGGDTITDFRVAQHDLIMINGSAFGGGLPKSGALPASDFVRGTHANAAHGQFIWNASTHVLSYDADGTGSGGVVTIATLHGVSTLGATSIHLF